MSIPQSLPHHKQRALLLVPPLLIGSMWLAFSQLSQRWGARRGYFCAFLLYWVGWCLLVPLWILGPQRLRRLFAPRRLIRSDVLPLAFPLVLGYGLAFPSQLKRADVAAVLASAAIAAANGIGEELLWRGTYLEAFGDRRFLAQLYPSLGFALWHYAPQAVFPNTRPGGAGSLVAVSGLVGGLYSMVVGRQHSLVWTTISHVLFDFSGLGALIYRRSG